jgi:hypothetical protein
MITLLVQSAQGTCDQKIEAEVRSTEKKRRDIIEDASALRELIHYEQEQHDQANERRLMEDRELLQARLDKCKQTFREVSHALFKAKNTLPANFKVQRDYFTIDCIDECENWVIKLDLINKLAMIEVWESQTK